LELRWFSVQFWFAAFLGLPENLHCGFHTSYNSTM